MSKVSSLKELGLGFCDICDNYTPRVECDECLEDSCEICLDAYGCENI